MLGNMGLLAGLALLIFMALRGVNIFIAALLCAAVVALTNGLQLPVALLEYFPFGPLGAFTFAGKFFVLFLCGAIFGKVMAASQAASSIAQAITRSLGTSRTLWVAMSVCALLTYGGVVVFVVIFTMYPLGITLMREANLPKRLFCAATALGAGTFTMTALPGAPSIHNVIAASALGTDLFAGAWIGLFASVVMVALGMAYVQREWRLARMRGEGFEANAQDLRMEQLAGEPGTGPHWGLAVVPILLVLGVIMLPRLMLLGGLAVPGEGLLGALIGFSQGQPILWPSLALVIATGVAVLLFPGLRRNTLTLLGQGADDAIMPLLNTAAVIGFGGVVIQTAGFSQFSQWVLAVDLPPLLSIFVSVSVVSGIVGSSSGGLQIFMQTLAPKYLEMGVEPEVLHRIANIAAGGLDSLPHCGAVIAMLMIMGLTHKQAYKDIFVVTVLIPVVAVLLCIALLSVL
ncbi:GntP family permease [Pseudomonas sp. UBA2684]|uniref:GntP family permease n=1 Tax=Pseudomonas sp. UBA2684 TaxID=1947311 RepID=UPI000E9FDE6C|nr:GntP family permease [Pseudomonas sp. UBA2684]HBX57975.1 citrate transporter [Pseudomonas sp.]|tara:strand:+ start:5935 stop:7311 length:1377 start_codon:yes stop_codon:yes gene_type:complete